MHNAEQRQRNDAAVIVFAYSDFQVALPVQLPALHTLKTPTFRGNDNPLIGSRKNRNPHFLLQLFYCI